MEWIPGKPEGRRLRTPAMGPRLRFLLAVLSLALIGAGAGCGGRARPANVLLIVVDTLRADHLGSHGYPRGTSPNVDALARRSVVFPEAMSTAPWTLPSFSSLFTSRLPADHGMTGLDSVLREEEVTLAEALKAAGYRTGAFVNNALLRPKRGVAQGFDTFEEYSVLHAQKVDWNPRPPLPQVESWLDADRERPFFLMVHFIEPHAAYFPTGDLAPRWVPDSLRHAAAIFPEEGRIAVRTRAGLPGSRAGRARRNRRGGPRALGGRGGFRPRSARAPAREARGDRRGRGRLERAVRAGGRGSPAHGPGREDPGGAPRPGLRPLSHRQPSHSN